MTELEQIFTIFKNSTNLIKQTILKESFEPKKVKSGETDKGKTSHKTEEEMSVAAEPESE